jgi:hypothetical protein
MIWNLAKKHIISNGLYKIIFDTKIFGHPLIKFALTIIGFGPTNDSHILCFHRMNNYGGEKTSK